MKSLHKLAKVIREFRVPPDLTPGLIDRIMGLGPSIKTDYLKSQFLTKFVSHETDPADVRRNRAIFKWLCAERENESTTERLLLTSEEYNLLPRVGYGRFIAWCRREVASIIGDVPPVEALIGSFSGGASTSRSRTCSHPATKYCGKAHATEMAAELFFDLVVEEVPGWFFSGITDPLLIESVRGNVLFTVPKTSEIDRVACKEPDINMFMQKGIGNYFRSSLRRRGINLNDQSINRALAEEGSRTGRLATLDLSSASDSVTTELVRQLLPDAWFSLLTMCRSPVTVIDGEEHHNWMFSSMGNGFTFELESLLFYVLLRATAYFRGVSGIISVYGDDLIMPTELADYASWVLGWFGFQVNPDKSFTSGPFRESCGGHYWNGLEITPFYLREPIDSLPHLIHMANSLRKWGDLQIGSERLCSVIDPEIESIWRWLSSFIPKDLWGGEDLSFPYQLVSRDRPHARLQPQTRKRTTGLGGYLHWLNATWDRDWVYDAVETSIASHHDVKPKLRVRPVRSTTVPNLSAYFLSEIGGKPLDHNTADAVVVA